ncbi:MAG: BrnT family toxin [Clostridiales bacterium]|nr:BrnT family toxin [Clostridiales bacterium]
MTFEWDEAKNKINLRKHGIDFAEAQTVFYDENGILFDDPEHSKDEERFIIIGKSINSNICLVCHCYRQNDKVIRIISARKATRNEVNRYVEGI